MEKIIPKHLQQIIIASTIVSALIGGIAGFFAGSIGSKGSTVLDAIQGTSTDAGQAKVIKINEESAVISVAEKVAPAVVSIIVTKDLPKLEYFSGDPFRDEFLRRFFGEEPEEFFEQSPRSQNETEKKEIGGGSGFLISSDGYIITNKHVVSDQDAEYTVLLNDERKFDARVLALDPTNDIAVLKINGKSFPTVPLADSDNLKVGQTVIAIGNALGEFRNTVSTGVISGLARSIVAGDRQSGREALSDVIQTDASINPGNSGGPLLNIAGQVIGINTAIVFGAQNIGFAIPVNEAKKIIGDVREHGRIIRPWLGVRYLQINKVLKDTNNLTVDYGALVIRGEKRGELAVIPGSPADKAGIQENDIILDINGKKIDEKNPLQKAVARFKPGDTITLKILHKGAEKTISVKLEERKE